MTYIISAHHKVSVASDLCRLQCTASHRRLIRIQCSLNFLVFVLQIEYQHMWLGAHKHLNGLRILFECNTQNGHCAARNGLLHLGSVSTDVAAIQWHCATIEADGQIYAILCYGYCRRFLQRRLHRSQTRNSSVRRFRQAPYLKHWHRAIVLILKKKHTINHPTDYHNYNCQRTTTELRNRLTPTVINKLWWCSNSHKLMALSCALYVITSQFRLNKCMQPYESHTITWLLPLVVHVISASCNEISKRNPPRLRTIYSRWSQKTLIP